MKKPNSYWPRFIMRWGIIQQPFSAMTKSASRIFLWRKHPGERLNSLQKHSQLKVNVGVGKLSAMMAQVVGMQVSLSYDPGGSNPSLDVYS